MTSSPLKMKGPDDLCAGLHVWMEYASDRVTSRYVDSRQKVAGRVSARRYSDELWVVNSASATDGYGPLLYHCVMESLLDDKHFSTLCSDRNGCSLDAAAVWEHFRFRVCPMFYRELPEELWVRRDLGYTEKQLEALNCSYRKLAGTCLSELRRLGKLVEVYND